MKPGALLLAMLAIASSSARAADEEPICADRPGKANPSCTVPAGMVQVETGIAGWSHESAAGMRSDTIEIAASAVKFGLSDRLHIEFDLPAFIHSRTRGQGALESRSGLGDSAVALKYRASSKDAPVQVALYPFVKLPTANHHFGNGKVEGGAAILVDSSFGKSGAGWNIAPEIDLVADGNGSGRHLAMVQAVSLSAPLAPRLSAAVDLWGNWDWDPAGTVRQFSIGPSAAFLVSNSLQLDAGIDIGLNRNTPDVELYSGIAMRF